MQSHRRRCAVAIVLEADQIALRVKSQVDHTGVSDDNISGQRGSVGRHIVELNVK